MSHRGVPVEILPFGGLNNGQRPVAIQDRECPDCRNVRFREDAVVKRDGCSKYLSTAVKAGAVTGIFELAKDDGTTGVIAFASDECKRKDGTAWASVKGAVTLTAGQNNIWRGAVLDDILALTNNVDAILKWTGGTANLAALGGSPPTAAAAVVEYHNYLIFLNTLESGTRYRTRTRWSDLNNAESYTAANYADLLNAGGQYGVGFGKIGDQLYAFLSGSIYQISYTGDAVAPFANSIAAPSVGAVSAGSIIEVDGAIFFASKQGVFFFNGGTPQYVSRKIETTWRSINAARWSYIQGIHNAKDGEVKFSISTGSATTNTLTLVFDYVRDRWAIDDGYVPNVWAHLREDTPLQPVFGDSSDGYVQKTNTGLYLDDASAITSYVLTKPHDFGDSRSRRKVSKLEMVADSSSVAESTIQVRTAYDLVNVGNVDAVANYVGGAQWDSATWDVDVFPEESQLIVKSRPPGHGRFFQAELRNAQASNGMRVSRLTAFIPGVSE